MTKCYLTLLTIPIAIVLFASAYSSALAKASDAVHGEDGSRNRLQNIMKTVMHRDGKVDSDQYLADSEVTVHRINLGVSNAYLLEFEQGMILVDAGMPYSERLVLRKMKELERDDLLLIYITHAHIDHYGGADALRQETGAPIAIHRADADMMARGRTKLGTVRDWENVSDTALPYLEPLLKVTPTEADVLLEDGDSLAEYGIDAYVLYTPGHTPGSTTLMVEDRFAFVGDLVAASNGKLHAQRSFAENWVQVAQSIDRLGDLQPEFLFAGHGAKPIPGDQLGFLRAYFVDDD